MCFPPQIHFLEPQSHLSGTLTWNDVPIRSTLPAFPGHLTQRFSPHKTGETSITQNVSRQTSTPPRPTAEAPIPSAISDSRHKRATLQPTTSSNRSSSGSCTNIEQKRPDHTKGSGVFFFFWLPSEKGFNVDSVQRRVVHANVRSFFVVT